jgi:hypothetical protein
MYNSLRYRVKSRLIDQNFQMLDTLRNRARPADGLRSPVFAQATSSHLEWERRLARKISLDLPQAQPEVLDFSAVPPYNPVVFGQAPGMEGNGGQVIIGGVNGGDWVRPAHFKLTERDLR